MKTAVISFIMFFASLNAFANFDKDLVRAYPGEANTKLIKFSDIKSAKIKETFNSIEMDFEMGDGYYSTVRSAYYLVFTKDKKLAGFMKAALMSYTEDPEYYLTAVFVNVGGVRVGDLFRLNSFQNDDKESIKALPKELRP